VDVADEGDPLAVLDDVEGVGLHVGPRARDRDGLLRADGPGLERDGGGAQARLLALVGPDADVVLQVERLAGGVEQARRRREAGDAALIVVPAQDKIIRLIPPLIVDEQEIDEALSILESVARAMPAKAA